MRPTTPETPSWPTRLDRGTRLLHLAVAAAVGVLPLLLVDPAEGVVDGHLASAPVSQQLAEVRARQASTER